MKNDASKKVTCITNEKRKDEIIIDYYNKEGIIIGTIAIDETGRLGWIIWDKAYEDNILSNVSYIFGRKVENTEEDIEEAKQPNMLRWDRAQEFIINSGLYVNYKQNDKFNETFINGIKR